MKQTGETIRDDIYRYTSPKTLSKFIKKELKGKNDVDLMLRVIGTQLSRIINKHSNLNKDELTYLMNIKPIPTGSKKWDALLEGCVKYMCHKKYHIRPPNWTNKTTLDSAFIPRKEQETSNYLYTDLWYFTPVELMNKGVLVSKREMETI
jgi:hypothetical protein